jgi:hypothetical protein
MTYLSSGCHGSVIFLGYASYSIILIFIPLFLILRLELLVWDAPYAWRATLLVHLHACAGGVAVLEDTSGEAVARGA